ncbi:unnamed protein product [Cylindrotheca closterium]|uniref:USP domain-containing protein n=1 Tax=Cylindrotheca closterium TaxID=2856 RepID=A0AAD2FSC9_9STRA|nr:unnamed protein product [Cylindrotheca closterium]
MKDFNMVRQLRVTAVGLIAVVGTVPGSSITVTGAPLISTGLKNLGNTCYMNAQLECAFHIPAVRQITLAGDPMPEIETENGDDEEEKKNEDVKDPILIKKNDIARRDPNQALVAMQELIHEMTIASERNLPSVIPKTFCMRLGIPTMEQQDSQEFWKLLLPAMKVESLSDLYKGSFKDYIRALDGSGREKVREELFLDISLDIASSSSLLESMEKSFGEPELLSEAEGNGWRPEKGADKVDAHKGCALIAKGLPSILQCHLKRFNYDWQTETMSKLNSRFAFPEVLDLSKLCGVEGEEAKQTIYDLQSVVIHVGEYRSGHYYSYVRPDVNSDIWYRFNDDDVEEVSFQEVISDAYGGGGGRANGRLQSQGKKGPFRFVRRIFGGRGPVFGWGGRTANAYVVQYVRRSDIPTLYES